VDTAALLAEDASIGAAVGVCAPAAPLKRAMDATASWRRRTPRRETAAWRSAAAATGTAARSNPRMRMTLESTMLVSRVASSGC
jgi:hypothetical protein